MTNNQNEEYKFEDFENQFNEIEKEKIKRPFISEVLEIEDLLNEYKNGSKEIYKQIQVWKIFRKIYF